MFHNSITLGKFYKPSKQPFLVHQPDSRIQKKKKKKYDAKLLKTKDFDHLNSRAVGFWEP